MAWDTSNGPEFRARPDGMDTSGDWVLDMSARVAEPTATAPLRTPGAR